MKKQAQTTNATIEKHTDSNQMEGQLQWEGRVTQVRFSNTVQVLFDELYCFKYHPPLWNTDDSKIHLRNIKKHLRRELKDCSLRVFQSKHEGKIQVEIKEELLPALHDILNKNKERRYRQLLEGKACGVKAKPAEVKQETPSEEVQDQHLQQIQFSDYVRNLSDSYQMQTHRCHELQHQLQCMNAEREQLALDLQQERAKNTELEIMHHDLLDLADERNKTMEATEAQLDEPERSRALCEAQLEEQKEELRAIKAALEEQKQEVGTLMAGLEDDALKREEEKSSLLQETSLLNSLLKKEKEWEEKERAMVSRLEDLQGQIQQQQQQQKKEKYMRLF